MPNVGSGLPIMGQSFTRGSENNKKKIISNMTKLRKILLWWVKIFKSCLKYPDGIFIGLIWSSSGPNLFDIQLEGNQAGDGNYRV